MIHGIARSGAEANLTIPLEVVGGEPPNRKVIIEKPIPRGARDPGLLRPTLLTWGVRGLARAGTPSSNGATPTVRNGGSPAISSGV